MRKIDFAIPSERLIGFTIPQDRCMLVADHNEVWRVTLGEEVIVTETDIVPYALAAKSDVFVGWSASCVAPVMQVGDCEVSHDFDPQRNRVAVQYHARGNSGVIEFLAFSGDWFCASLSREGDYLVLADPYRLEVFATL